MPKSQDNGESSGRQEINSQEKEFQNYQKSLQNKRTTPYNRNANTGNNNYKQKNKPDAKKKDTERDERIPKSASKCKKQVRDINRLLNSKQLMPSTKRLELERRIKALTVMQTQLAGSHNDKANATRYHGVKFIERKKVLRKLEQLDKKIIAADRHSEEFESLRTEKRELLMELNYTTYYPDEVKYISLFPADPKSTSEDTKERQAKIKEAIRAAMGRGDLPKDAREVVARDRKAIRRSNKFLLRSVSLAHGLKDTGGDSENEDDSDDSQDNDNEGGAAASSGAADIEQDEFFA
ncbi:18S rRNA maturation protein [Kickxella alabastrina]|uniref:18S rRNA maturation protein n=1 Tax=Kickxella alabastrina TaxID=61397 RepID=A0ACC1ISH9_9FUNG|nr:18S rRNA maturation protein [Kickxella alabastrina]